MLNGAAPHCARNGQAVGLDGLAVMEDSRSVAAASVGGGRSDTDAPVVSMHPGRNDSRLHAGLCGHLLASPPRV